MNQFSKTLKSEVSEGKAKLALAALLALLEGRDNGLHNQALLLHSNLVNAERDFALGVLARREAEQSLAKVKMGLLQLIDEAGKLPIDDDQARELLRQLRGEFPHGEIRPRHGSRRLWLAVGLAVAVLGLSALFFFQKNWVSKTPGEFSGQKSPPVIVPKDSVAGTPKMPSENKDSVIANPGIERPKDKKPKPEIPKPEPLPPSHLNKPVTPAPTLPANACGECGGSGSTGVKVKCKACRGDGWVYDMTPCGFCNRTGYLVGEKCGHCSGAKMNVIACNMCSGTGQRSGEKCFFCKGAGKTTGTSCIFCDGTGMASCPKCNGKGAVKAGKKSCTDCNASGRFEEREKCKACKGQGTKRN